MDLNKAIKERKSVRKFSSEIPDWKKIIRAIDLARLAPCPGNQSFLSYIIVNNPNLIEKIGIATQQDFVGKSHYIVVVISNPSKIKISYGDRAQRYVPQATGAAIENFLLSLTSQGLSTCWIGLFHEKNIKEILEIPDSLIVEALFPIGLELQNNITSQKKKTELDEILFFNEYKNKKMVPKTRIRSDWA